MILIYIQYQLLTIFIFLYRSMTCLEISVVNCWKYFMIQLNNYLLAIRCLLEQKKKNSSSAKIIWILLIFLYRSLVFLEISIVNSWKHRTIQLNNYLPQFNVHVKNSRDIIYRRVYWKWTDFCAFIENLKVQKIETRKKYTNDITSFYSKFYSIFYKWNKIFILALYLFSIKIRICLNIHNLVTLARRFGNWLTCWEEAYK